MMGCGAAAGQIHPISPPHLSSVTDEPSRVDRRVIAVSQSQCRRPCYGWMREGVTPSRLRGPGCHTGIFLEILDAKLCIFVHPESLTTLQLWKNFNMTGQI